MPVPALGPRRSSRGSSKPSELLKSAARKRCHKIPQTSQLDGTSTGLLLRNLI